MSPIRAPATAAMMGALMAAVASLTGRAVAAPPEPLAPSPDRGAALAERLCAGCHLTGSGPAAGTDATVTVGIPTFRQIATRPGQTARAIEGVLIAPHPPMPDMRLTGAEIADLVAYLDVIRTGEGLPPLQEPPRPPRRRYPTPS